MKKLLPAILICLSSSAFGQYRWDVGVNLGAANYLGEMGGAEETRRDFVNDLQLMQTRWMFGAFTRYEVSPTISFNLGFNYGRISGADSESENPARQARNLSFRNDIQELSLRTEITLLYDNDVSGRGYYNPDFKLYGFFGIAGFHHNPKTQYTGHNLEYQGEYVALQPLKTEGVEYKLFQFSIPAGVGLYFTFDKQHRIGWEIGYRTTFTDYLDDVSTTYAAYDEVSTVNRDLAWELSSRTTREQIEAVNTLAVSRDLLPVNYESFLPGEKRGDATNNDGYIFTQFSYSYVLKGRSSFSKRRYHWIKKRLRGRKRTRAKF